MAVKTPKLYYIYILQFVVVSETYLLLFVIVSKHTCWTSCISLLWVKAQRKPVFFLGLIPAVLIRRHSGGDSFSRDSFDKCPFYRKLKTSFQELIRQENLINAQTPILWNYRDCGGAETADCAERLSAFILLLFKIADVIFSAMFLLHSEHMYVTSYVTSALK